MEDAYNVKTSADGQVIVILHANCQISNDQVLALLREAGVDVEKAVFLGPEDALSCDDLDDSLVVIPLDAEVCDQPELEDAARHCSGAGGQVVGVFGPGFAYDSLHPIADKYGKQCGWSPNDFASCISKPESDTVLDGTGAELKRPEPKQVKCN